MAYVLDTNIYIEIERANPEIIGKLAKLDLSGIICITSPSYSEICLGLLKGRKEELTEKLEKLDKIHLLNTTRTSSRLFSKITHELGKKGKIIPLFDILIASIVMDNKMTLITMDEHFRKIPGLKTLIL